MNEFEALLLRERTAVESFVRYRLRSQADADDLLQEIWLTAYRKFPQLKDHSTFKSWVLAIARSKCSDYFRQKTAEAEFPAEALRHHILTSGRHGIVQNTTVLDALEHLSSKDRQILYLYFWKELPQTNIARRLHIPIGTVKSRLHTAKQNFKRQYTPSTQMKGDEPMTKLPEKIPAYTIEPLDTAPFRVRWEELQGWMIVPRLGEKITWGLYDAPSGKRTEYTEMSVIGKTEIHGIEGVEITAVQYDTEDYYRTGAVNRMERRFVAQLTDTHSRYLAESHIENGVRKCYTFLDGDAFLNNWGFGENNCGNEVNLFPKGILQRQGNHVVGELPRETVDVVDRCRVTIGGKNYDTVRVMDIECFNDAVASEQFIDQNGRTVLWRRFNRDDWAFARYQKKWTELLPENERLIINGETYVHWYDCITDYIL